MNTLVLKNAAGINFPKYIKFTNQITILDGQTSGEFMIFVVASWHENNGQLIDKSFETNLIRKVLQQIDDYPWQSESDYFETHQEGCGLQLFRKNLAHELEIMLMPDNDNQVYLMAFYEAKTGGFLGFGRKKRKWDTGRISLEKAKLLVKTLCSTPLEQLSELPKEITQL